MSAVEFIEPLTHEEGVSQATKLFVDTYGAAPEGVWAAPGRVNLIGEHTDYTPACACRSLCRTALSSP